MTVAIGRVCTRCVYNDQTPGISFDAAGVCNYCHVHDTMVQQYPTGPEGDRKLGEIVERIKRAGRGKQYDCVVGVSGGCDSSWMLYKMVEHGLRPLAVHFDNTWNSPIATTNIYNVLEKLDVQLFTHVVNNKEFDDTEPVVPAGWRQGHRGIRPTSALTTTLYLAAEQHGVKYIIEGHSFRTEGDRAARLGLHGRQVHRVGPQGSSARGR